jgi:hypothetical protein
MTLIIYDHAVQTVYADCFRALSSEPKEQAKSVNKLFALTSYDRTFEEPETGTNRLLAYTGSGPAWVNQLHRDLLRDHTPMEIVENWARYIAGRHNPVKAYRSILFTNRQVWVWNQNAQVTQYPYAKIPPGEWLIWGSGENTTRTLQELFHITPAQAITLIGSQTYSRVSPQFTSLVLNTVGGTATLHKTSAARARAAADIDRLVTRGLMSRLHQDTQRPDDLHSIGTG